MAPANPIRFVKEIGLYAFSRGRPTCLWRTPWCVKNCYNNKFYRVNPKLPERDALDEEYWQATPAFVIAEFIRDLGVERFRFAVRGEAWVTEADVWKVRSIITLCPDVHFWIPTRAWRGELRRPIEIEVTGLPNSHVVASIDPTNSLDEETELRGDGWSTVFAGDNDSPQQLMLVSGGTEGKRTQKYVKCVKTWKHDRGHCAICENGCFSFERLGVHLKQHQ